MRIFKKLGKKPARIDHRTLKLSTYLKTSAQLPPAPPAIDYTEKVSSWPMFLNNQYGDCVIAGAGHMIQGWTANAGQEVRLTDDDILTGYEAVGGFDPNDPQNTDNGCNMLDALNYWRQTGFGGHQINSFVAVNWKDHDEVNIAIDLFGGLYLGFLLPASAQKPQWHGIFGRYYWDVTDPVDSPTGQPGSWGGHCVCAEAYETDPQSSHNGLTVVTWGELYDLTPAFLDAYCEEAFAIVTQDWIEQNGQSPSGFDLPTLQADLASIT